MRHPILSQPKRIFVYIMAWFFLAMIQFVFLYTYFSSPWFVLLVDILIQNSLLAFFFLGFWYALRYVKIDNQKLIFFVNNHVFYLVLVVFLWLTSSQFISDFFLGNQLSSSYKELTMPLKVLLGVLGYILFVFFMYLDNYYQSYLENKQRETRLYQTLRETELKVLRSQLNPHFMFNSLHSISSLTLFDPDKAHEMTLLLADFLRYTLQYEQEQKVALKKELDMCQAYMAIEKIRFGDKIYWTTDIAPNTLDQPIPSLLVHTLLENALKHGLYGSVEQESIFLQTKLSDKHLIIKMENTFDPTTPTPKGSGTGLKNIRERLALLYSEGTLVEQRNDHKLFSITLYLPLES